MSILSSNNADLKRNAIPGLHATVIKFLKGQHRREILSFLQACPDQENDKYHYMMQTILIENPNTDFTDSNILFTKKLIIDKIRGIPMYRPGGLWENFMFLSEGNLLLDHI